MTAMMNHSFHESRDDDDNERVEPGELLEDGWFFGNLLESKPRMLRSYSDPCSSSNYNQDSSFIGKSYEETYDSIKKHSSGKKPAKGCGGHGHLQRSKSKMRTSSNGLIRAPSLPTSLESDELQDEDVEFSMGKLIRQASLNYSDHHTLPPRTHTVKGGIANSNLTRQKSRRNHEVEGINRRPINQLRKQKSLKDLETEELQGFKDLGFEFDKIDLNSNVVSMIPGLQEKKRIEEDEEVRTARPYLSEAWPASAAPVPRWGGKKSTEEDMKAQIKFWARAVASNVRQEC